MKRGFLFLIVFVLLFSLCVFSVSAESFSRYQVLGSGGSEWNNHFGTDLDFYLIYCPSFVTGFYSSASNDYDLLVVPHDNSLNEVYTVRFVNNGTSSVHIVFNESRNYNLSSYDILIYPNSYVDVSSVWVVDYGVTSIFRFNSVELSDDSYSVWNASSLISNVGNMFNSIYNSAIFPLLLIGVCISLGFVAIRYVRKVMWGN